MNNAAIGGLVRSLVAFIGGWLVSQGYATSADIETLATNASAVIGTVTLVATIAWSWWSKRANKAKPPAALGLLVAFLIIPAILITGCVAIRADSNDRGASVWAMGWGADSSAQLANVAVTGPQTNAQTGVSFDSANGEQKSYQAIQSLVALGAALAPMLAAAQPAPAPDAASSPPPASCAAPAESDDDPDATAPPDYSTDGYGGSPGPAGEGVYGRPSCSRCRAYKAAHPDTPLINIDTAANRAAMWAALRRFKFTGTNAALPVRITAEAYASPAN